MPRKREDQRTGRTSRKREDERTGEAPRTDLPAEREPYYEGYFGTEEEEGVEREHDAGEPRERDRRADEDSAGGDREIERDR